MKYIRQSVVAVVGGDSRQLAVAEALAKLGARVRLFGHCPDRIENGIIICTELAQVFDGVNAVILPISGMDAQGMVRGLTIDQKIPIGEYLKNLPEGTVIITGSLPEQWFKIADERDFYVYQYAEDDRVAILNSVPTAEGALQLAMEHLPITIHDARVLVIGFGRVGVSTARAFKALGAQVIVSARRRELLARAWEMGCDTVAHADLFTVMADLDLIINTVPALVITGDLLKRMRSDVLIIDLASPPGGTDFQTAQKLNIKAILAPGLPGKVAPKTAGAILATAVPEILDKILADGGE